MTLPPPQSQIRTRTQGAGFLSLFLYFLVAGLFVPGTTLMYRAVSCTVILFVALRLFVKRDSVGYAKLALAVAFTAHQQVGWFFMLLTAILYGEKLLLRGWRGLRPIYLLVGYGGASYLLNQFVEVNLLSYPFFLLSFFFPVIFFAFFQQDEVARRWPEILDFFFLLLAAAALVIVIQTAVYWRESPDYRTGGTGHPHMAGVLICTGFIVALAQWLGGKPQRAALSGKARIALVAGLPLVFLVDAKYVFAILLASVAVVGGLWLLANKARLVPVAVVVVATLGVATSWDAVTRVPIVLGVAELGDASVTLESLFDGFRLTPRGQILEATLNLPRTEPRVFLLGSGPGTFLSRAANSRAYDTMQKSETDPLAGARELRSKLPSFIPPFTSWVMRKYALDVVHWSTYEEATWQSGLVRWVSSLTSFFWEFGIVGVTILVWFYSSLVVRGLRSGRKPAPEAQVGYALATIVPFFLGVAYFDLWLEMPQFALLHWSLLGLLSAVLELCRHSRGGSLRLDTVARPEGASWA